MRSQRAGHNSVTKQQQTANYFAWSHSWVSRIETSWINCVLIFKLFRKTKMLRDRNLAFHNSEGFSHFIKLT